MDEKITEKNFERLNPNIVIMNKISNTIAKQATNK